MNKSEKVSTATPGPWHVSEKSWKHLGIFDASNNALVLAAEFGGDVGAAIPATERVANMRLIAAAPDLLAACVHVEAVLSIVEPRSDKAEYLDALHAVRAAISKATGRTD